MSRHDERLSRMQAGKKVLGDMLVHLRKTAIEACRVSPLHFSLMVRAYCPNPAELYAFS